ncbi:transmembrane amino acid transporter protein [Fragilaria crotonensis]|nr:transmembrane amino acid transporter protein [Fragilaria crotonensis]
MADLEETLVPLCEPSSLEDTSSNSEAMPVQNSVGSSIGAVVFNFTNSIIGAGAIGLGGAIASSGGAVSITAIVFFAVLTKISLDMVIDLSIGSSYEELGRKCYGIAGWSAVLISKMLYAFGCLVAYIVVVKDNFCSSLEHLTSISVNETAMMLSLCTFVILPLCLLRDMTPLSSLSLFSVVSMGVIVAIVLGLYFDNPNDMREHGGSFYEHWFQVRSGLLPSLGTFVFSFVSQHTVHLAFESLRPELQTLQNWKRISFLSIALATIVSLSVGVFVYMTFWEHTGSDLFVLYPALPIIDVAKLLLCMTMVLTFPFPFFTCRDMLIVAATLAFQKQHREETEEQRDGLEDRNLDEPLLQQDFASQGSLPNPEGVSLPPWLIADRQLEPRLHLLVTTILWAVTTALALVAPNLGDVLNLVGCATGTVIAFILPSLFSFRLRGYSHTAMTLLVVGGLVGGIGTFFSTRQLIRDATRAE